MVCVDHWKSHAAKERCPCILQGSVPPLLLLTANSQSDPSIPPEESGFAGGFLECCRRPSRTACAVRAGDTPCCILSRESLSAALPLRERCGGCSAESVASRASRVGTPLGVIDFKSSKSSSGVAAPNQSKTVRRRKQSSRVSRGRMLDVRGLEFTPHISMVVRLPNLLVPSAYCSL